MTINTKKYYKIIIIISLLLFLLSISTNAFELKSSLRHELSLEPGATETIPMEVENSRDFPIKISVSAGNIRKNENHDNSLLPWVEIRRKEFVLQPKESGTFRVEMDLPEDKTLPSSQWTYVYAEEEPAEEVTQETIEEGKTKAGALALFRYEIAVVNTLPDAPLPQGKIKDIEVKPSPLSFKIEFANTGKTYTQASGKIEVRDATGETITEMEITSFPSYPGNTKTKTVQYEGPKLEVGEYLVLATIDFGGEYVTSGQMKLNLTE